MPQLDVNTFGYQYIGIITTFFIVYIFLSYGVLPNILLQLNIRQFAAKLYQVLGTLTMYQSGAWAQLNSPTLGGVRTFVSHSVNTLAQLYSLPVFVFTLKFFSSISSAAGHTSLKNFP